MLLIPAYAKVNLCLSVRGRRPDGFHDIDSVAVAIDWHDLVGLSVRPADATVVRLRMAGSAAGDGVPVGEANLATRAASAVAALVGPVEIDVWLAKRVPSLAGLGGGSADAAAVLRGCAAVVAAGAIGRHSGGDLDVATLHSLAASLGSDVPLALAGGAQRVSGRGEWLAPLESVRLHLVVAIAGVSDTTATYAAVEKADFSDSARADRAMAALEKGEAPRDADLGSALERAACRANPDLGERLAALRAAVPRARWHLTGSGGAAFTLAAGADDASAVAAAASGAGFAARACRTIVPAR